MNRTGRLFHTPCPSFLAFVLLALPGLLGTAFTACERSGTPPPTSAQARTEEAPPPLRFLLKGSLTLPDGKKPVGAMVFCPGTSLVAFVDEKGDYTIPDLPPGEYRIMAQHPECKIVPVENVRLPEAIVREEEKTVTLASVRLERRPISLEALEDATSGTQTASVSGRVILSDGGSPRFVRVSVKGAEIFTAPQETGEFLLSNLKPGITEIVFELTGYETSRQMVNAVANQSTRLTPTVTLNTTAPEAARNVGILGRVLFVDPTGQVAERNKEVTVTIVENQTTVAANSDGSFEFADVPAGQYTLVAQCIGFELTREVPVTLANEPVTAILVLREKQSGVTGIVKLEESPSEVPLAGTQVALSGTSYAGVTASDGAFRLLGVPQGAYTLLCMRNGYKPLEVPNVQVEAGEVVDVGTLLLERDVEYPKVVATAPEDGANEVTILPENQVHVTFNKKMDPRTIQSAISITPDCKWAVREATGAPLSDPHLSQYVVRISNLRSSESPLQFNTAYTVTIGREATDMEGNSLQEPHAFKFRTGGLTVIQTFPADGARNIPGSYESGVVLTFNGVVDPKSLSQQNVSISPRPYSRSTSPRFETDPVTGWTVYYDVPVSWKPDTEYTVRLGSGIRSRDGVGLSPTPYRFSFRTAGQFEVREMKQ
jgi:hypothetical protein